MKKISLFSFALSLIVSSFCLAEPDDFFEVWVGRKNPFRRKTKIIYPNGTQEIVYRKDSIDKIFEKCRRRGACKGPGHHLLNIGSFYDVEEGAADASVRLLDLAPRCNQAVIKNPPALEQSNSAAAPVAGQVQPTLPPTVDAPKATTLSDDIRQSETPSLYQKYENKLSFVVMALLIGWAGYNSMSDFKSSPKRR